jgi:hypothetical protein
VLLGATLACCAHAPAPIPRPVDHPAPRADSLFAALVERHRTLRTAELETRTTSWLGKDRVRATVLMLVDRAGRLRFEAEVPVQGAVASLVVHGREFAFLDLQQHVFRRGPACPANVALLIPIPLMPDEIAAVLLGDAPLGEGARATDVLWDGERRADVLVIERPSAGAAGRLWVTFAAGPGGHHDVVAVEGEPRDDAATSTPPSPTPRWRVVYDDRTRVDQIDQSMPNLIRFAEPGRSFDDGVEIKVKARLAVNQPLRDESFVITPPPGYPIEVLSCPPRRTRAEP